MNWGQAVSDFQMYLQIERGLSENSIENYTLDIQAFQKFLEIEKNNISPLECEEEILKQFIYETAKVLSPYTQARRIAGLRSFFDYLIFEKYRSSNPTDLIETPKLGRKLPDILSIEEIESAIDCLYYASPDHNKIYPYFVKILGKVTTSFNDLNLGWEPDNNKDAHINPHTISVKVIYRELVATLTTKTPKSKAWEECLPGIPPINPVKALNANFKSKIFTNQTKANAYKVIMKLLWFGEKCTPLHKISHLQWLSLIHI
mgnify:CR=1 FL=1